MATASAAPVLVVPQLDLKHILVTTDFSDHSRLALKQAAAIARLHQCDLTVLHLVPPDPIIYAALEAATYSNDAACERAQEEVNRLAQDECLRGTKCDFLLESGALERTLDRIVKDRDISMLVLGTHGRTGFRKIILGSVAEEIFRMAQCPVLTIGPDVPAALLTHGRFQSVLFATDFSAGSQHALPYAIGFAQESRAKLTMLHVLEEGSVTAMYMHEHLAKNARQRLREMAPVPEQLASPAEIAVVTGYPVEEILRIAREKEVDLIVLGVHKSGGMGARTSAHLPWTIAHSVVCHAKCPVLTVRG
jgi:nucleotide-binding universal stress UspA family protein